MWEQLGSRIFDEHLDKLKEIAVQVLKEPDPKFELEPSKRLSAKFYGKTKRYSNSLRKSLAETACSTR